MNVLCMQFNRGECKCTSLFAILVFSFCEFHSTKICYIKLCLTFPNFFEEWVHILGSMSNFKERCLIENAMKREM